MERAYGLMRKLRELDFTNHELFVIFRKKVAEVSIKRNTRGVEVRDTTEHDQILEKLTDFTDMGYEVADIGGYKESKAVLDEAKYGLTFDSCAMLAGNLRILGVDTLGLVKLSDELTGKGLTTKSIRANIDLNDELKAKGITVKIQEEILAAAKSYSDPPSILGLVNAAGGSRARRYINEDIMRAIGELRSSEPAEGDDTDYKYGDAN